MNKRNFAVEHRMRSIAMLFILLVTAGVMFAQAPPRHLGGNYRPTDDAVGLSWRAPETNTPPDHYNVYRHGFSDSLVSNIGSTQDTTYDDTAVPSNTVLKYHVTAVYAGDVESRPSNFVLVPTFDSTGLTLHPPTDLVGSYHHRSVDLEWQAPDSLIFPPLYKIYRQDNNGGTFKPIGMLPMTKFSDRMVQSNRTYSYYVTSSYLMFGESGPSDIVTVQTIPDSSHDSGFVHIRFTTEPVRTAFVNQPYSYDADIATDPPGIPVVFSLHHAPAGMTIDSLTGLVQWTPAAMGIFGVEISARASSGHEGCAKQEYGLFVLSGNPGSINGTVQNTGGEPVPHIRMKLYNMDHGHFVLRTESDGAGHYAFSTVNPGTYLLLADADNHFYRDQWFDGAERREDATPIIVTEGSTFTANFTLSARDSLDQQTFLLSGSVKDTSENPINGAKVSAYRIGRNAPSHDHFDDHAGSDACAIVVQTDVNGNYSFTLRAGEYIVGVRAEGYVPQFWNHKRHPFEANRMYLVSDTSGIDFHLTPRWTGTGLISGFIRSAADSTSLRSFVLGFCKRDSNSHHGLFVASGYTDSTGLYTLDHLPGGNYIILSVPAGNFIPTFYNTGGGTPLLSEATPVPLSGDPVVGIDIYAIPDSDNGLNSIAGMITTATTTPDLTSPVGGALVTILDAVTGTPVASTTSGSDGRYFMIGLSAGLYTVMFQEPGFIPVSLPLTVMHSNNAPTLTTVNAQLAAEDADGAAGMMSVRRLWNLVSLPVDVENANRSAVFPASITDAFSFGTSGEYEAHTILSRGTGYWLKFPNAAVMTIPGTVRSSQTIELMSGWNLIGSISTPVPVTSMNTVPANILDTPVWGYEGGYAVAGTIEPGKGYWICASAPGTLTMRAAASSSKNTAEIKVELATLSSITFTDATGGGQTLFTGYREGTQKSEQYAMPPLPPSGAFDVRFSSSRVVEFHPAVLTNALEYGIDIRGAAGPLTITWKNNEAGRVVYSLRDENGKVVSRLISESGSSTLPVSRNTSLTLRVESSEIPKEFGLQQNYPNPFNPTTSISFGLPVQSRVTLKVFNIIGQEVATLLNGEILDAGKQSTRFDASNLPSGVYFYRLAAASQDGTPQSFVSVKKMMLVK